MLKIESLETEHVTFMPPHEEMKDGVLYVSNRFSLAIHLCACGCRTHAHPLYWQPKPVMRCTLLHNERHGCTLLTPKHPM